MGDVSAKRTLLVHGLSLAIGVLLAAGCASSSGKAAAVDQPIGPGGLTVGGIQSALMSYADTLSDQVAQASDLVAYSSVDPGARVVATTFKLQTIRGGYTIAAGPNPLVGVIDMAVMVTLTYQATGILLEEERLKMVDRGRVQEAMRRATDEIWDLAAKVFEEPQINELHELIDLWRRDHPEQVYVANIRFSDFAEYRGARVAGVTRSSGGSIFRIVGLDPLANLDPTTREIEQSRMLAERMFFYMSRMPMLLGWQIEEVTWGIAASPETRQVLANTDQFASVADRLATFTEELPDKVTEIVETQRAAALADVESALDRQRDALFAELNAENVAVDKTLAELRTTVEAAQELSTSLNATVDSVDRLASKFVSDGPASSDLSEPSKPSEPVTMSDVQHAIEQTTVATAELNKLVTNLDSVLNSPETQTRLTEIEGLVAIAEAGGARLLNRAFLLLAGLVVLIFAAWIVKARVAARVVQAR